MSRVSSETFTAPRIAVLPEPTDASRSLLTLEAPAFPEGLVPRLAPRVHTLPRQRRLRQARIDAAAALPDRPVTRPGLPAFPSLEACGPIPR